MLTAGTLDILKARYPNGIKIGDLPKVIEEIRVLDDKILSMNVEDAKCLVFDEIEEFVKEIKFYKRRDVNKRKEQLKRVAEGVD